MLSTRNRSSIREKTLIKLKDQLGSTTIPLQKIKGLERSRHYDYAANNFLTVNQKSLNSLGISSEISYGRESINLELRSNGIIGATPIYSSESRKVIGGVIVEPRFGWSEIGPLMQHIGWAASPELLDFPMVPGSAKEIPPWVLAGPIIERLSNLLRNINRGFNLIKETRESPRGKILWQEYITKSYVHGMLNKIPCMYPDLNQNDRLRSYIKWALDRVKISLATVKGYDATTENLLGKIDYLLNLLRDIKIIIPTTNTIEQIVRDNTTPSLNFLQGLQAITWVRDERGLAGRREPDGLAWKIQMSDLFEKWVEAIVLIWARKMGGDVTTSRKDTSRVAILWQNQSIKSLSNLIPDIVVTTYDTVYIIDAKYKKFYEELDDQKWRELSHELQEEHRHDLHQVLAYASLFNKPRIVSLLAYPLTDETFTKLTQRSRILNRAHITVENKILELGIFGVPLVVDHEYTINDIASELNPLITPINA